MAETTAGPLALGQNELIVDNFAGGGGASLGIEMALGRSPDIAINHDREAVAMHTANHPDTRHFCEDVWDIDPVDVCSGRPVGLAWFSPDCKHFSKAKGGKPVNKRIRGLAWVVVRWAKAVRPRVIILENVEEFQDWGPLADDGRPCRVRKGFTFRRWLAQLKNLGYRVEWRELRACDYGAPTIRKRLFLVARCDDQPIVWPKPSHGDPKRIEGSLFDRHLKPWRTAADCIDWSLPCPSIFERSKPLADKTLRRVAAGVRRYVIEAAEPFIVGVGGRAGQSPERSTRSPYQTITSKADAALCVPTLIQTGYGEREGQAPRVPGLEKPLGTVVGCGQKHALVAAFLAKHYGGVVGSDTRDPIGTVTATDHHSLVTSHLVKLHGTCKDGQPVQQPVATVRAEGTHIGEVRTLLTKYGPTTGPGSRRPELVTVNGEAYQIADIGLRMLSPRELFRAQGFPDSFIIDPVIDGKHLTKTAQVRMCGNSVSPPIAAAMARAQFAVVKEVVAA